jgi:hypothetical protein
MPTPIADTFTTSVAPSISCSADRLAVGVEDVAGALEIGRGDR